MNKKTLVLGASLKAERYSNRAIKRLRQEEIEVEAIGLKVGEIADVRIKKGTPKLQDIHTVTLYLNSNRQQEYYDYILGLQPQRVIFNPGTENDEFIELLEKNNIEAEIACTLVLLSINQY